MSGWLSITFDDALSSVYNLAFPEMERIGATGTVFVISDLIGKQYSEYPVMSERMLKSLASSRWEIGSHTRTHQNLTTLSDEEVIAELWESKKSLKRITPSVTSLAYPFGACDNRVEALASRQYSCGRTVCCYPPLKLNRTTPGYPYRLSAMSTYDHPFNLPIRLINDLVYSKVAGRGPQKRTGIMPSSRNKVLEPRFVRKWLRNLKKDQWLILCFHNITQEKSSTSYSIEFDEFRKIIDVVAGGPDVVNMRDVLQAS
jgi:hypothetical protein